MARSALLLLAVVVWACPDARALSGSGNSAVGSLETAPPSITGFTVDPAEASSGESVSMTFVASEDIPLAPFVTVNGEIASLVDSSKATSFEYEYTVQEADPLGAAPIEIVAADAVGNTTTVNDSAALTIIEPVASVPVLAWPAAIALLLAGIALLALRCRRSPFEGGSRGMFFVLLAALPAAPTALAQSPTVSNVAFAQQPTPTSTEVVITYDLDSPNGPSDITVSFSKDGGSDGFSFPVTSVTGDLTGITTGTGYTISWDIAADYPNEVIPNAQLRVTAEDGLDLFTLSYTAGFRGSLIGDASQSVVEGNDGTAVTVVPDSGFAFVDWTDGSTDNPRTDTNVSSGISVTANFISTLPPAMISVPAGSFDMGRTSSGDDASFGRSDELPVHAVTLSAHEIGKFEVTNQQVCDVYNWADDQGFFTTVDATTATAFGEELLDLNSSFSHIEYAGGVFQPETRTGDPGGATVHSMADHPVQKISWFGAAAFCNWLSQIEGLTPVYDTSTWAANFANNGYHLPTEAQWERAAAWDGSKHWIYSVTSDTLTGRDRANYNDGSGAVNPLGLTAPPFTTPVGWFDGSNVSPNGSIATVDSVSPTGAYDMSGNLWEWCHDWYDSGYYGTGAAAGPDPEGPASSVIRVFRGGSWATTAEVCRSAVRNFVFPDSTSFNFGFRLAK